jgi:hypothetical protein
MQDVAAVWVDGDGEFVVAAPHEQVTAGRGDVWGLQQCAQRQQRPAVVDDVSPGAGVQVAAAPADHLQKDRLERSPVIGELVYRMGAVCWVARASDIFSNQNGILAQ